MEDFAQYIEAQTARLMSKVSTLVIAFVGAATRGGLELLEARISNLDALLDSLMAVLLPPAEVA